MYKLLLVYYLYPLYDMTEYRLVNARESFPFLSLLTTRFGLSEERMSDTLVVRRLGVGCESRKGDSAEFSSSSRAYIGFGLLSELFVRAMIPLSMADISGASYSEVSMNLAPATTPESHLVVKGRRAGNLRCLPLRTRSLRIVSSAHLPPESHL